MPNLTLKISRNLRPGEGSDTAMVHALEETLAGALDVPRRACNVFVVEAETGSATAPLYLELVYRASAARTEERMHAVAARLTAILRERFDEEIAFRGFPMSNDTLVAANFAAPTDEA